MNTKWPRPIHVSKAIVGSLFTHAYEYIERNLKKLKQILMHSPNQTILSLITGSPLIASFH